MAFSPCTVCGSTQGPDHLCPGSAAQLVGQVLDGRYQIESVLGQGGMGMVFKATQTSIKRPVAVKTLHSALASSNTFFERFRREAETASRLHHPNVITIFDFGRTPEGTCYYVMELLGGESLRQLVKRDGPLSLRRAAAVIEQASRGLAHAHQHGCVHRDLKPHNLMLQKLDDGELVKVLDFGLVKALEDDEDPLTSTGQVLGTPQYMPPEQALGEPVDQRSDLYALTGVLYYCLTGSSPFGANTVRKALHAAQTRSVAPVASLRVGAPVPRAVDELLRKGLAREKQERYQSVEELVADLRAALAPLTPAELDALPEKALKQQSVSDLQDPPGPTRRGTDPRKEEVGELTTADIPAQGGWKSAFERSPWRFALLVIPLALFVAGGLAVKRLRAADAPLPDPPNALAAPAPPRTITVRVVSSPPGATVWENGEVLGITPLSRTFTRDEEHALAFELEGYMPASRAFQLSADEAVEVRLEPLPSKSAPLLKAAKRKTPEIPAFE